MGHVLEPILEASGPTLVHVVRLESGSAWRRHPAIIEWLVPLIDATCQKANATRKVRRHAVESVLDGSGSYVFDSAELAGPAVTLGVSASHEAGATYVAFSDRAIAIDCCDSGRAREILSGGLVAFSNEEFEMLASERALVHGWCAIECLCKLWGAGILQPSARPQLLTANPMTAESTEFGPVRIVDRGGSRRDVFVWATKRPSTSMKGAVSPWEK